MTKTKKSATQKSATPATSDLARNPNEMPPSQPIIGRLTSWNLILIALGVFGFLTRFLGLNKPTDNYTPVFDEKHYVPQAWQIARSWDSIFLPGIEDNPAYGLVVHPPLAKQLEALSMMIFGYTPWGWRAASALAGLGVILFIAGIARRLSKNEMVGLLAGVYAICDGILFVTARSGMLDHLQALMVVAASYFAIRDAHQTNTVFRKIYDEGRMNDHPWGPRMGFRWWRAGVVVALGLAVSIKWSGLYYMAFFGITVVLIDYLRRRRYGVTQPLKGTAALDIVPNFAVSVIYPSIIYLLTWRAWFASESGVYRHAVESGRYGETKDWAWGFLPDTIQNFIYYHVSVLQFHSELTNSNGHHHSWESKPWSWLATTRSLMYYNPNNSSGKHTVEMLVGTPAIWWVCVPALLWATWCWAIRRQTMWAVPVMGFAAGFVPWLFQSDRQMYLFYATNLAPYLVIILAMIMGQIWNSSTLSLKKRRILVIGYSTLVVWNFLFFLPIFTSMPLSDFEYNLRMWLPSWS